MNAPLFASLLALTLLDLAFVHATGAVGHAEMAPLWALALAAPWLRPLQRHFAFRAAWNVGVLAVFAMLVRHATTSGLRYMLEDGLALAALCQVHLVNNVGRRQQPDLLFFNSFLVAFVTSFFAPDLTWCALFVAHAFVFVPALHLQTLAANDGEPPAARVRAAWRAGSLHAALALALTALAFVAIPRDFRRQGWLGDALQLAGGLREELADSLRVDDERQRRLSQEPVAVLKPASGDPADVPTHWRSAAYIDFDGAEWTPQEHAAPGFDLRTDVPWARLADGALGRSGEGAARRRVDVGWIDRTAARLPVPLTAVAVSTRRGDVPASPRGDGGLLLRPGAVPSIGLTYTVEVADELPPVAVPTRARTQLTLPPIGAPTSAQRLAATLRDAGGDPSPLARAKRTADWLRANRRYALPGADGFAPDLDAFLAGDGTGHCEYFATALALLLRLQGVPCRLVAGYLAQEWDPQRQHMVVRASHAHAWVEALDASGRWRTFDATPAADAAPAASAGLGIFARVREGLANLWSGVVGFNAETRREWLEQLANAARTPQAVVALALLLGPLALLWRRRRAAPAAALLRAARRAGLAFAPGETPRELLARAAAGGLPAARHQRLADAVQAHEAARYATSAR